MWRNFIFLSLFLVSFTASAAPIPRDPNPVVEKALALKEEVTEANAADIKFLWDTFQAKFQTLTADEQAQLLAVLDRRLASDREKLRELRAKIAPAAGFFDLKSSVGKLVGIEDAQGKVLITGILQDAQTLLAAPKEQLVLYKKLEDIVVERNQITVLKTLLVYANVLLAGDENLSDLVNKENLETHVQMLYRAATPADLDKSALDGIALSCESADGSAALYAPNAGYVFGGNLVGGKSETTGQCRGVDCSSFVSYCAASRVRMSTMYMDFLWRQMKQGESAFTEAELPIRKELIDQYQFMESISDFEALDMGDELRPGDLITWRGVSVPASHTAIYLSPIEGVENEFVAIEANREDLKSKEGIEINVFKLERKGIRTTILRRK